MRFEENCRYRVKAIEGQIETIETTGTVVVEVLCEVVLGPLLGQRIKWRGYLNSPENAARAVEELRAAGWRAEKLGRWDGLGSTEFEGTCQLDEDDKGKKYPRLAWLRSLSTLKSRNATKPEVLDQLSQRYANVLKNGAPPTSSRAPASSSSSEPPAGMFDDDDDAPPNSPSDLGFPQKPKQDSIPF